jgi:XTP/dITP diphosphohydrolase
MHDKPQVYLATSNVGKIRDFEAAARNLGVTAHALPGLETISPPCEDGETFEANARFKAEYYSRMAPGKLVAADDSGLVVDELNGAPGVHSARYAAVLNGDAALDVNSDDADNNRVLIAQIEQLPQSKRTAKFVCVIAVARDGTTLETFYGETQGELLTAPRGNSGFGYDPLFYFPALGKTFAEIPLAEKARYSHRGKAFRKVLEWVQSHPSLVPVALR